MDTLFAMDVLLRSVERGGFAGAARELGVSPSALSKVVAKLERRLGVKLLHRTTRRLRPTAEGETYLERARRIVDAVIDADNEAMSHGGAPSGRLRMVVGVSFGTYALVPALPEFLMRFPAIELDLVMGERAVDPAETGADLSIRLGPLADSTLIARRITDVERVICASPDYVAAHGAPRDPASLVAHSCLSLSEAPDLALWPFTVGGRRTVIDVRGRGRVTANNAETLLELALMGQGVVRLPDVIVGPSLREGRLVRLLAETHVAEPVPVQAIYPYTRQRPPKVGAMIDFLVEKFADAPWRGPPPAARAPRPRVRPRRRPAIP
ncbi:HTH-type transcriptional regulator DmlR [Burkholderiales bacterium]|nr:HTH-type transcriptional regulator DmlR [Burkholderiales bacterium]